MKRSTSTKAVIVVMAMALLASGAPIAMGFFSPPLSVPHQSSTAFADPAFQSTWERTDLPVQNGKATDRSWLWGPQGFFSGNEPWVESPGGKHLVQYFDKSRMEVNDPNADRKSQWFVTNGLLVVEMMNGQIKTGNTAFTQSSPAAIPVAGDASASVNAPTYASAAKVASLQGNNRAPDRTGQAVNQILDRSGNVSTASMTQNQVTNAVYEATLGHNIPNVFWTFMNQSGVVYQNGQYFTDKVFDWVFAMGYPLTEPYWIQINVNGHDTWVLMQAYQRRILTFNPNNDPKFQVEMGNVGRSYYDWRYGQQGGPLPSATAVPAVTSTPAPATLKLNPASGPAASTIGVLGTGYAPYAGVNINVSASAISYNQTVTTVAADAVGNFSAYVTLPGEVSKQPNVVITATGASGSPALPQTYTITHSPSLNVSPLEVTSKGVVKLSGADFTANTQLTVAAYQVGSSTAIASIQVTTDGNGAFAQNYTLTGKGAVGAQYNVVATGPNGLKAQAPSPVKIIPLPTAHVNPISGPTGVEISFSGSSWPINRPLRIQLQGDDGQYQTYNTTSPVVTDGAGNFSTKVLVPSAYQGQSQVRLWATDDISGLSISAPYTLVNPTPPPANPQISIVPNPIVANQPVKVYGSGFPAGQIVSIAVGTVGGPAGPAASANADGQGNFSASFNLASSLANAGMVTVSATSTNGTNANVNVGVVPSGGTPPAPSGLPMTVHTIYYGGTGNVKVSGTGWPANQALTAAVMSSNGSVNQVVGSGTVKADGSFQLSFDQSSSWAGRTDIGVKVTAANGANSVRYLPVTSMAATGSGTYTFNGANWPRNVKVITEIVTKDGQTVSIGSANTDSSGVFRINAVEPGNFKGNIQTFEVFSSGQPYSASFQP